MLERRLAVQGHHGQPRRKQRLVTGSREHRRHESRCSGTETTDSSYCGRPTDNPRQNRSSCRHGPREPSPIQDRTSPHTTPTRFHAYHRNPKGSVSFDLLHESARLNHFETTRTRTEATHRHRRSRSSSSQLGMHIPIPLPSASDKLGLPPSHRAATRVYDKTLPRRSNSHSQLDIEDRRTY